MSDTNDCKDCTRYVPNEKYDSKRIMSAEGYCTLPKRRTGGLLGTVEAGETLNIIFARGRHDCDDGRNWFVPIEKSEVLA